MSGMYPNSDHNPEPATPDTAGDAAAYRDAGLPENDIQQLVALTATEKPTTDEKVLDERARQTAKYLERRFGVEGAAKALDGASTLAAPVLKVLKARGLDTHPKAIGLFAERYMKSRGK